MASVLAVVTDDLAVDTESQLVLDDLVATHGHTVTVYDQDDPEVTSGYDVVLIMDDTTFGASVWNVGHELPTVVCKTGNTDEYELRSLGTGPTFANQNTVYYQDDTVITWPSQTVNSTVTFTSNVQLATFAASELIAGGTTVVEKTNGGDPVVVAFPIGTTLDDSTTSTARVVFYGIRDAIAGADQTEPMALLDACLEWAADLSGAVFTIEEADGDAIGDGDATLALNSHHIEGADGDAIADGDAVLSLTAAVSASTTQVETVRCEIAFGSGPLDPVPAYTAIPNAIYTFSTEEGRGTRHEQYRNSTLSIVMDSTDGSLDPSNTAGPYYQASAGADFDDTGVNFDDTGVMFNAFSNIGTQIRPNVRIRLVDMVTGETIQTGWVDSWVMTGNHRRQQVSITASGALKLPGRMRLATHDPAAYDGDTSGARIGRVLNEVGWPSVSTALDRGDRQVAATEGGQTALDHMILVAESEGGAVYPTRDGAIRFDSRLAPLTKARMNTAQAVFDDDESAGLISFVPPATVVDEALIRNHVRIGNVDGYIAERFDQDSIDLYGPIVFERLDLLLRSPRDVDAYAELMVNQWATPRQRLGQLILNPVDITADEYASSYQLQLRDRVTVKYTPHNGDRLSEDFFIESIRHEGNPSDPSRTTFQLSSAERFGFTTDNNFWRFDGSINFATAEFAP